VYTVGGGELLVCCSRRRIVGHGSLDLDRDIVKARRHEIRRKIVNTAADSTPISKRSGASSLSVCDLLDMKYIAPYSTTAS
jgi:hypothetical protein